MGEQELKASAERTIRNGDADHVLMDPYTRTEFEIALDRLLYAAHRDGVDVGTGVDLRHLDPDVPDWEVEITPIRKRLDQ